MAQLIFGYLAVAIIILSIIVITRRNPIHSVIGMLFLFIHIGALYLTLNAEFLAAVQIIVYAGAILVLFLFAIMILNIKEEVKGSVYIDSWILAVPVALGLIIMIILEIRAVNPQVKGIHTVEYLKSTSYTKAFGMEVFTNYILPFEVISLILLVAIVGAIVLAKKKL